MKSTPSSFSASPLKSSRSNRREPLINYKQVCTNYYLIIFHNRKIGNAMHRLNDRFVLSRVQFLPSFLPSYPNPLDGSPNHPDYPRSRSTWKANVGTAVDEDKRTIRVDPNEHLSRENAREIITGLAFSQIKGRRVGLEPLSRGSLVPDRWICLPRRFNEWPEFTSTRDSPAVRRSTMFRVREGGSTVFATLRTGRVGILCQ